MGLRHHLSDNEFFLSQLDVNFDRCYQQLLRAYRGFINAWFAETDRPFDPPKVQPTPSGVQLLSPEVGLPQP